MKLITNKITLRFDKFCKTQTLQTKRKSLLGIQFTPIYKGKKLAPVVAIPGDTLELKNETKISFFSLFFHWIFKQVIGDDSEFVLRSEK